LLRLNSRSAKTELVLLFLAFAALDVLEIRHALPHPLFGDEWRYLYYADNLLHGFYSPRERVFLWNGPGYPLLILPFVKLGWTDGARYANAFWHAGTVAYAWAILRPYVGMPWKLVAVVALGLYQPLVSHLPLLYTETVCCFLMLGWAYHASQANSSSLQRLIAGSYLGVLCLTKVIFGVGLLVFIAVAFGLWLYRRIRSLESQLQISLLALAFCVPYLTYTYQLTGRWLYWSSAVGNNFYWLTSPYREESGDWYHQGWVRNDPMLHAHHQQIFDRTSGLFDNPSLGEQEQLFNLSTPESADVFLQAGLRNVRKHPFKFVRNYLANLSRLFFDVPVSVRGTPFWNESSVWNLSLLAWTGLVLGHAWRRRVSLPPAFWPSVGFALLSLLAYTLSSLSARFLIPFVPLWWVATWAWFGVSSHERDRPHSTRVTPSKHALDVTAP
jgi:uncharacterized membrane protein